VHHLTTAFLFAHNINHGINLAKEPTLEYLYYLAQIGLSVSPISNKALFLPYVDNPFPHFFKRGLNVTLTTDDPLMFHMTPTPLLEEYASARLVWGLTMVDLCEIAHNSVHISSLPDERKKTIGSEDLGVSNVPPIRFAFRRQIFGRNQRALNVSASSATLLPYRY
jgi:AMP deaminase